MARSISTAGQVAFRVTIDNTVPANVRFVRALSKTNAKVSDTTASSSGKDLVFVVWLNPMRIAQFRSFCAPVDFQFIAAEAIHVDGSIRPTR